MFRGSNYRTTVIEDLWESPKRWQPNLKLRQTTQENKCGVEIRKSFILLKTLGLGHPGCFLELSGPVEDAIIYSFRYIFPLISTCLMAQEVYPSFHEWIPLLCFLLGFFIVLRSGHQKIRVKREGEFGVCTPWVSACGYTPFQAAPCSLILSSRELLFSSSLRPGVEGFSSVAIDFSKSWFFFCKNKKCPANLSVLSTSWNPNWWVQNKWGWISKKAECKLFTLSTWGLGSAERKVQVSWGCK